VRFIAHRLVEQEVKRDKPAASRSGRLLPAFGRVCGGGFENTTKWLLRLHGSCDQFAGCGKIYVSFLEEHHR